ncbi:MAG: hypothetical protein MI975_13395, partial [Cytophagales bacterium]|nr:hypothetical protein [Cytophagales bacterium]
MNLYKPVYHQIRLSAKMLCVWMFTLFACIPTIGLGFSPGNTSFSNHLFGESDPLELILYLDMQ